MLTQFRDHRKSLPKIFLLGAAIACLSACEFTWPEWATLDEDPLQFMGDNTATETDVPPPPDLIPKDAPDQNDPASDFVPTSTMGVNLETYFIQDINDPETRIQRLENVVLAMHQDMQNAMHVSPPKANMAAAAPQPLTPTSAPMAPLKPTDTQQPPLAKNIAPELNYPEKTSAPAAPMQTASAPAITSGNIIKGIRVGQHPGKIRIVFDVTTRMPFKVDLDNNEHLLLIELPEGQWQGAETSKSFGKTPLLDSFRAEPSGNGTRAILQLKGNTRILSQDMYPAFSGPGQRLVIDLSK